MSLFEQIEKDYIQAYKAKDSVRLTVLRLLKTAVKNKLVDLCRPGGTLDDGEMMDLIIKEGKQRQDSIEQYTAAGRSDLADKEVQIQEAQADYEEAKATEEEQYESMKLRIQYLYEAEQEKQKKVNDLKSQCQKIIFKATEDAQKAAFEANSRRREIESTISSKEREIAFNRREIESGRKEIERLEAEIKKLKAEQDDLRGKWYEENGKAYNGETICPHCGQELPVAMVEQAREIFIKEQVCKCNDLNDKGMLLGTRIKDLEARIKEVQANIENVAVDSINAEIEKLKAEFSQLPVVDAAAVVPESIPEWVELQEQIKVIEATISTEKAVSDVTMTESEKKSELNEKRDALKKRLANRDAIKKYENEIERLEARAKELAQQIANAEKEEYTIEQFTRTKIDECETRINSMFKFVTFRLFDYTLENNAVETCIPLVGGVPYPSANTAGQINAGLDIINTLCKFYGICAPIFIDNRESVNDIIETESQIINLVVNKDNFLTIK